MRAENTPSIGPETPRVFEDPGESSRLAHFTSYLAYFGPGPIARRRPLISRTLARMASRKFTLS